MIRGLRIIVEFVVYNSINPEIIHSHNHNYCELLQHAIITISVMLYNPAILLELCRELQCSYSRDKNQSGLKYIIILCQFGNIPGSCSRSSCWL